MTIAETRVSATQRRIGPILVGLIAVVFAGFYAGFSLAGYEGDPTIFLAIGEDLPTATYAEELLGTDIAVRPGRGHDGQYFFLQANDPLLLDPATNAQYLDLPSYRSQRMLYPLLAGAGGLFPPATIVWTMLGLSVLTFGIGTIATAYVAMGMGAHPGWGLAFGFNIGVLSELAIGGTGHFALALVMVAVAMVQRGRLHWSVVALVLAVLTREVMLLSALGIAAWLWLRGERRPALMHVVFPGAAVAAWALYIRWRLADVTEPDGLEALAAPLAGLFRAAELWPTVPMNLAVGLIVVLLLVLFVRRLRIDSPLLAFAAAGFAPLAVFFSHLVWFNWFDISRAIAPVITAYLLITFAARHPSSEDAPLARATDRDVR